MARIRIAKHDGTLSRQYFWNDDDADDRTHMTVYKKTDKGVRRMRGVHFDAVQNKIEKD